MLVGLGVDVLHISRFSSLIAHKGLMSSYVTRLAGRVLHKSELARFEQHRQQHNVDRCVKELAGSWCVKEALYKSLDDERQLSFQFKHWWREQGPRGRPQIGGGRPDEHFLVSVSHDGDVMMASVARTTKGQL